MTSRFTFSLLVTVGLLISGTLSPPRQQAQTSSALTSQEKAVVLAAHNKARKDDVPGNPGPPLPPLEWDDDLAAAAHTYAETLANTLCVEGDHDPNLGEVGENLFWTWTTEQAEPPASGAEAVASWVEEKSNYDYASNSCEAGAICGHYTQVVWRDTRKVGCGRATCIKDGKFYTHWVCRYSPGGNVNVETTRPY